MSNSCEIGNEKDIGELAADFQGIRIREGKIQVRTKAGSNIIELINCF
jgi:hypothetical protein